MSLPAPSKKRSHAASALKTLSALERKTEEKKETEPNFRRQRQLAKFTPRIQAVSGTTVKVHDIGISSYSAIECVVIEPPQKETSHTLFYIPGAASAVFCPHVATLIAENLSVELNCKVIVILHRLSKQNRFPIPVNDITKVINSYLINAAEYDIDPHNISIGGYSSGGLLSIQIVLNNIGNYHFSRSFALR